MRADIFIDEVLAKCDVLKRAAFWPDDEVLRPRAWLQNFDDVDKPTAAALLDRFTFYSHRMTDALLRASYLSLADGMPKGPAAPSRDVLVHAAKSAVFTPVKGEEPGPTDSGYLFCRRARQLLGAARFLDTDAALDFAYAGGSVVFVDDFVGSGDQFLGTWDRQGRSFADAQVCSGFTAIYLTLVSTQLGLEEIHKNAPTVAVCSTHVLENRSTLQGLSNSNPQLAADIHGLLDKYYRRLIPNEDYMLTNPQYLRFGYKKRGLMLAFAHSVPDATLPLFWSKGTLGWEPLIERN